MAGFLAMRVFENKLRFEDVPDKFKESVKKILKEEYGVDADENA